MDLSVIVVNYNTYDYTKACLASALAALNGVTGEIILVDNASKDGSIEALCSDFQHEGRVQIIKNDENLGFAAANNIGLAQAQGDFLLLLNSDTVVREDTFLKTVGFMRTHPLAGALGGRVLLADGTLDHACKRGFPTPISGVYHTLKLDRLFPNSRLFGQYDLTYVSEFETAEVDCLTGAYMCVRREVYQHTGGLDEDYFMYGEDIDWCWRIVQAGYKIIYYPEAVLTHYKKKSWTGKRNPKVLDAFYDSMVIFYNKHYKDTYSPVTGLLVRSGTGILKKIASERNKRK